jgi:nucleoside-diphosphate-sugar epimerase
MKVLLAGASGAIGMPLICRLHAAGHEVLALHRSPEGRPGYPPRERPPSGSTCSVLLPWSGPCKGSAPTR